MDDRGTYAIERLKFSFQRVTLTTVFLRTYTLIHVLISLLALLSGLVVLGGLLTANRFEAWTKLFLTMTILTSVSGFFFPFHGITPARVVGAISLVVLGVAIFASYRRHLAGAWRKAYVASALLALYLNVLVLIVQAFKRIPALKQVAPMQNEPPFKITQVVILITFIVLGVVAANRFHLEPGSPF